MNGIEKITARIETDAKAETAEILREAEEKAAAVRAQYEAQAKQEAEEAKKAGIEAARRQAERLESAAQMEAKKQLLAAKQASLNEAFDKAQAKLLALPDDQYAELLAKMAVKAAKTGREEIILNAKDRDRVGPQVVAKANVLLAEAVKPQPAGKALEELKKFPQIKEVRGRGLMIGLEFEEPIKELRSRLIYDEHVFTGASGTNVLRLLPPLCLSMEEADEFLARFKRVL